MAQVAIIVNGAKDARKAQLAKTLGLVLGCPVFSADAVHESLAAQTGPMAPADAVAGLALDTVWRLAALVEAGVVIDATWSAADAAAVRADLAAAGSPRVVELWCHADESGQPLAPLALSPVVDVDTSDDVDMDDLMVQIGAHFN